MSLKKGTRVDTPLGAGWIAYVRMASPDYSEPVVVSVVLDARKNDPGYAGTLFPANDVTPAGGCYRCGAEDAPHETVTEPRLRACVACYERLMRHVSPGPSGPPCDGCGAPYGAGCDCPENRRAIWRGERRKAERGG